MLSSLKASAKRFYERSSTNVTTRVMWTCRQHPNEELMADRQASSKHPPTDPPNSPAEPSLGVPRLARRHANLQ